MDRVPARPIGLLVLVSLLSMSPAASADPGTCAGISTAPGTALTTVRVASGLVQPTFVTAPPGDTARLFILEQRGTIRIVKNGVLEPTAFLDISALTRSPSSGGGGEQGLLGLAFHPGYATNGWFFVYHTTASGTNVVARYDRSAADPDVADPTSRQVVISFAHPTYDNHNGGMLAFGPDGKLYIGTGDGGDACDPTGNAQSHGSALGKLHRINVDSLPYTVPADNPFVGQGGYMPEIWATGLRNPWRYSFDRETGDLYIGDVGQNDWEEVDFTPAPSAGGLNYGWDAWEGKHCPNPSCNSQGPCDSADVLPVLEYNHDTGGCAITGGYVYRGCRMPDLRGTYFYADYCAAFIHSFRMSGGAVTGAVDRTSELAPGGGLDIQQITSFGEDGRGEVYIVDQSGEVFKIVPVLTSLEVSGPGAPELRLGASLWAWEDLEATSSEPIASYRVYRQTDPGGTFSCVHQGPTPTWAGGDPSSPPAGSVYAYLVIAVNAAGQQTSPGTGTGGIPRVLSLSACP